MANSADILRFIQLINALLGLSDALGLSWDKITERIRTARAEGRPFGVEDLHVVLDDGEAALARLRAMLDAAPEPPVPEP